jgi:hypothetical protein
LAPEWAIFRLVVGGRFLPNFDLANVISTYTKDFSWKKRAQIDQVWRYSFPQITRIL